MSRRKQQVGRPSTYTEDIAKKICNRLSEGESLRKICQDETMPNKSTVFRWMDADPDFATRCARAREDGADVIPDQMIDIEDKVISGNLNARAAGVVLSSMQWRASKLAPKKYGTKVDITSSDRSMSPVGLNDFYADLAQNNPAQSEPSTAGILDDESQA